jgi:putative addiction module killer protein
MIEIQKSEEFEYWFYQLNNKEQAQVSSRLERIHSQEHFGDVKNLEEGLYELRWKNGWRVYFVVKNKYIIKLLIGGHKNEQKKDINKARILIKKRSVY